MERKRSARLTATSHDARHLAGRPGRRCKANCACPGAVPGMHAVSGGAGSTGYNRRANIPGTHAPPAAHQTHRMDARRRCVWRPAASDGSRPLNSEVKRSQRLCAMSGAHTPVYPANTYYVTGRIVQLPTTKGMSPKTVAEENNRELNSRPVSTGTNICAVRRSSLETSRLAGWLAGCLIHLTIG